MNTKKQVQNSVAALIAALVAACSSSSNVASVEPSAQGSTQGVATQADLIEATGVDREAVPTNLFFFDAADTPDEANTPGIVVLPATFFDGNSLGGPDVNDFYRFDFDRAVQFNLTVTSGRLFTDTQFELRSGDNVLVSVSPDNTIVNNSDGALTVSVSEVLGISAFAQVRRIQLGGRIPPGTYFLRFASESLQYDQFTFLAQATESIPFPPDLTIEKEVDPAAVTVNNPLTYTITVANEGDQTATDVEVRDNLPPGFVVDEIISPGFTATQNGTFVQFTGGTLAAGQTSVITISGFAPPTPGQLFNNAVVDPDNSIQETNENNNQSSVTLTVFPEIVVNTTSDGADANLADGFCLTAQGECSIRAAIMQANAIPGANIIVLPAGNYELTLFGEGEAAGDLDVTSEIELRSPGAGTIDARSIDRVLDVTPTGDLTVTGVTFTNGRANQGAGIRNQGVLSLTNAAVTNSLAVEDGGGIFNSGNLTLDTGSITGNRATRFGGGVFNNGSLNLVNSFINNNQAGESGGGVFNNGAATLIGNTISFNSVTSVGGTGGGIQNNAVLNGTIGIVENNTPDNISGF